MTTLVIVALIAAGIGIGWCLFYLLDRVSEYFAVEAARKSSEEKWARSFSPILHSRLVVDKTTGKAMWVTDTRSFTAVVEKERSDD